MKEYETTETIPSADKHIDSLSNSEALNVMLENHHRAFHAVKNSLNSIEKSISNIVRLLENNSKSKIIYVGAGTSGRIAVQDGVELFPTFGWPRDRIEFIIAGGLQSLVKSVEGAEDLENLDLNSVIACKINPEDIVIGLAASGNTKFTNEVLKKAHSVGAYTIGISNNKKSLLKTSVDVHITLDTGMEIVAGSTRLKAGTAQKICLNLISTLTMARLGRVKFGMMNNLIATNKKLKLRKKIIDNIINKIEMS